MKTRSSSRSTARAAAADVHVENERAVTRSKRGSTARQGGAGGAKRRKALGTIASNNAADAKGSRQRSASTARGISSRSRAASNAVQAQLPPWLQKDEPIPAGVRDIDAGEDDDPTLVSCFARSVYKHLLEVEHKYRPDPNYMEHQNDINKNMRGILVDWLVEVSEEYKLHTETLFLAVNYIDRYLANNNVQRGKLQLVGITCMLVAAKYEEIYPPSVEDFVYISDNAYTREDVIAEEVKLLNSLQFHCTVATARQFLRRFAKAARADHETHELSHYLAELSLLDLKFVKYPPSVIAASALLIAMNTTELFRTGEKIWDATMEYYTTYSFLDLKECATALLAKGHEQFQHVSQFRAVRDKYMQSKFDRVAGRLLASELHP